MLYLNVEHEPMELGEGPLQEGAVHSIGLLRNGTTEGKAAVAVAIQLEDGSFVLGQTTWRLLHMAHAALAASPIVAEEVIDP